jgi:hypothetical protein
MNTKKVLLFWGLIIGLITIGCVHPGTSSRSNNGEQSYYLYDSKYGGYPVGRVEKSNDGTYYTYDSKYGGYPTVAIPPEGLRRRGIHIIAMTANTEGIRWEG